MNPLYNVPGLGGYLASQDRRRAMAQEDSQGQMEQIKLADLFNATQKEQAMQKELGSLTPEQLNDPITRQRLQMKYAPAEALKYEKPSEDTPFLKNARVYQGLVDAGKADTPLGKSLKGWLDAESTKKAESSGNPYSTPVYDEKGRLVAFDNRTGRLSVPTSPFASSTPGVKPPPMVGAKWSPELQKDITAAEGEGKALGEQRGMLPNQKEALISVQSAKQLLSEGIYTGGYSKLKMVGAKFTPGVDTDKAARTEQFISHIGNTVVPRLKEFGGSDTVEEMNYLREIMGGNISLEASALKRILDQVEAKIQRGIDRLSKGMDVNGNPVGTQPAIQQPTIAAPEQAIRMLKANPSLAPQFKEKYGYLP